MPLTLEQIVEETRRWSPEEVGELVGRLTEDLHGSPQEIDAAWRREIDRRIEQIQRGQVQGVTGEQVSEEIAKITKR
jgi:putative addiction module component (TIGR02574 family)